jgi:putative transposase
MSNWRPDFQPTHLYFITTKAIGYAHVFKRDVIKRLLLDTFDSFRLQKRWKLYCFVIMPNHFHCIAQFTAADPLDDVIRDYKKQTADRIIRHFKAEGNQQALTWLAAQVESSSKQLHKVWEDGYNAKDVVTENFLQQKMTYIHNNPCQPHWTLSQTPEDYLWSSARFYHTDQPSIIPIDDVRKFGTA